MMSAPSFTFDASENCVYWGTVRLDAEACEKLLDLFDRLAAAGPFLELYDAHMLAGGIARCTSLRTAA